MPTVINNPAPSNEGGNNMGFLLGVVLLIIFGALFFIYGFPYLRDSIQGPQINIPNKIDVNVKQEK